MIIMALATPKAAAKRQLSFDKPASGLHLATQQALSGTNVAFVPFVPFTLFV